MITIKVDGRDFKVPVASFIPITHPDISFGVAGTAILDLSDPKDPIITSDLRVKPTFPDWIRNHEGIQDMCYLLQTNPNPPRHYKLGHSIDNKVRRGLQTSLFDKIEVIARSPGGYACEQYYKKILDDLGLGGTGGTECYRMQDVHIDTFCLDTYFRRIRLFPWETPPLQASCSSDPPPIPKSSSHSSFYQPSLPLAITPCVERDGMNPLKKNQGTLAETYIIKFGPCPQSWLVLRNRIVLPANYLKREKFKFELTDALKVVEPPDRCSVVAVEELMRETGFFTMIAGQIQLANGDWLKFQERIWAWSESHGLKQNVILALLQVLMADRGRMVIDIGKIYRRFMSLDNLDVEIIQRFLDEIGFTTLMDIGLVPNEFSGFLTSNRNLQVIARHYDLCDISTWSDLVRAYGRKYYTRLSERYCNPLECLALAITKGEIPAIDHCLIKIKDEFHVAMYLAGKSGHEHVVQHLVKMKIKHWAFGLEGAAEGNHQELMKFFFTKRIVIGDQIRILIGAVRGGHSEAIALLLDHFKTNWNDLAKRAIKEDNFLFLCICLQQGCTQLKFSKCTMNLDKLISLRPFLLNEEDRRLVRLDIVDVNMDDETLNELLKILESNISIEHVVLKLINLNNGKLPALNRILRNNTRLLKIEFRTSPISNEAIMALRRIRRPNKLVTTITRK
jgi:hypothetical protein